ncbi:MAG: glycosyltransferase family 4 protein, partial [Bilophila wadsworthia]
TILRLHGGYGPDLMSEVYRYACAAVAIARKARFDVIHVHDWMTYPAGILVRKLTGKPLVAHIHALEHDRSGDNMNRDVAGIERAGLEAADRVVAVSHYTKRLVMRQYGIPGDKIEVVHNAVSRSEADRVYAVPERCAHEKRVLFMGRVTFQKGPDYFVEAAKLVLDRIPDVRFVMAGSGDMLPNMVRRVAQLRIGSHFHFTGFLKDEEVDHMYAVSDLYVMPSVSEPFGIAPLEAMAYDVPVLISRPSGVAEVVRNAIKVDFWDIREWRTRSARSVVPVLAAGEVRNCRGAQGHPLENVADRLSAICACFGENDMSALCFISVHCRTAAALHLRYRRLLYEDEDANCGIMLKVARGHCP